MGFLLKIEDWTDVENPLILLQTQKFWIKHILNVENIGQTADKKENSLHAWNIDILSSQKLKWFMANDLVLTYSSGSEVEVPMGGLASCIMNYNLC